MSNKSSKAFQADSYLLWWRLKQILLISSIATVAALLLSVMMFYRFEKLNRTPGNSLSSIVPNLMIK